MKSWGYFSTDEDGKVQIKQQHISAGTIPTDEYRKAYINSVLSWPVRLEYEVQYTERGEDQLAWASFQIQKNARRRRTANRHIISWCQMMTLAKRVMN